MTLEGEVNFHHIQQHSGLWKSKALALFVTMNSVAVNSNE